MNLIKRLLARARKMARNVGDAFRDDDSEVKKTRTKKEQEEIRLNARGMAKEEFGMGKDARERRAEERYNSPEAVAAREETLRRRNSPEARAERNLKARVNYLSERFEDAAEYIAEADVALENIAKKHIEGWMNLEEDELTEEERKRQLYYEETIEVITELVDKRLEKYPELKGLEEMLDDIITKG